MRRYCLSPHGLTLAVLGDISMQDICGTKLLSCRRPEAFESSDAVVCVVPNLANNPTAVTTVSFA